MSHAQIFMDWRGGVESPISLGSLTEILERHDCLVDVSGSQFTVTYPGKNGDSVIGEPSESQINDGAIFEFVIARPRYQMEFHRLAYDLIRELDLCMFMSSGEEAFVATRRRIQDLPEPLSEVATVVNSIEDFLAS